MSKLKRIFPFRKYIAMILLSVKNYSTYAIDVILRSGFLVVILFVFFNLWTYTYSKTDAASVTGMNLKQIIWYLGLTEAIIVSRTRIHTKVEEDIRDGAISYSLIRPYNYILFQVSIGVGERIIRFICTFSIGFVLISLLLEAYIISMKGLLCRIIVIIIAMIIDTIGLVIIGMLAFWVEDTSPFFLIYTRIQMILGGAIIPITVFPGSIRNISNWLPFKLMVYEPASLYVNYNFQKFLSILQRQSILLIVMLIIATLIFKKGVNNLNVNGG